MPNRIIRAGINRSERVDQLGCPEEVFYRRLLNEVDDHGLFDARPAILRATLFPLRLDRVREADISRWTAACQKAGLIVLYEAGGKPYLKVLDTRWKARSEPKFPLPPADLPVNEVQDKKTRAPDGDCEQLRADESNCEQLPAIDSNSPQLRPYSYSKTETKNGRAGCGDVGQDGMTPTQRLGERLQDFFPVLATNRPQLEGAFNALQGRGWTAEVLESWQGWYREKWPRSQMSHFNLLNTVNDYDEHRAKAHESGKKKPYCGNCSGGWRLPDVTKGEVGAQPCGCVEVG